MTAFELFQRLRPLFSCQKWIEERSLQLVNKQINNKEGSKEYAYKVPDVGNASDKRRIYGQDLRAHAIKPVQLKYLAST